MAETSYFWSGYVIEGDKPVEYRPVRHGRWIKKEAYKGATWAFYECSECGESSWTVKHKFCPNCGADNREVDDDG